MEKRERAVESVDLEETEILVCVGRGLSKKEDMETIGVLAKALKAEIGCTKRLCHDW